jgi:hypothetical protein
MAAHAMRLPRRRRWPRRIAGLLGTAALLGSGAAIVLMVMPEKAQVARPPTAGPAVKDAKKSQPALTRAQKRARRAAVAKLAAESYEPVRLTDWRPGAKLNVLVGRNDSDAMRAFFFANGKFVGYDDPATSNHVRVVTAGRSSVTLAYRLNDGGTERVRFQWRDGTLTPTSPVPVSSVR